MTRARLPDKRRQWTQKVTIGTLTVHLSVGEYEDGTPGEVFLNLHPSSDETLRALLSSWAIAVSVGLQYGVPWERYVSLFARSSFAPCGVVVGSESVKGIASSVLDWAVREVEAHYAPEAG